MIKKLLGVVDSSYIYAFLGEATLGLTFVFYIALARVLGPAQYGIFSAATALGGILSIFILFGFHDLLAREVAANPQKGPTYTFSFLVIQGITSLLTLFLLFPLANELGFEGNSLIVCYFVVLAGVCRCAKQTVRSVLRGLGDFKQETIAVALERAAVFLIAGGVLIGTRNLVWVVVAIALTRIVDLISLIYYISQRLQIWTSISTKTLWNSLKMAYPFALSGVLWVLYYQVDILMLKRLAIPEETGFYGSAYQLIEIFSAFPRVIFYVTLTKLARCYSENPEQLSQRVYNSVSILLVIVLPLLILAGFVQFPILLLTYGQDFSPAIDALAILLPSIGVKMFATLILHFLQAIEREKLLPPILLLTVGINMASNFVLIPSLGAAGAAIATLLSEAVFAVAGFVVLMRIGYGQIGRSLCLISLISLLAAAIPSLTFNGLNLSLGIPLLLICLISLLTLIMSLRMI